MLERAIEDRDAAESELAQAELDRDAAQARVKELEAGGTPAATTTIPAGSSPPEFDDGIVSVEEAGLIDQFLGPAGIATVTQEEYQAIADRVCALASRADLPAVLQQTAAVWAGDIGVPQAAILVGAVAGSACVDALAAMTWRIV